jgi:hypothetical protein
LTTKFDILGKLECPVFKMKHLVVIDIRWLIFLTDVQLYIFHKFDHTCMLFRLCMYFLDNMVEFHSRNQEVREMTRI